MYINGDMGNIGATPSRGRLCMVEEDVSSLILQIPDIYLVNKVIIH
jgi:hypothetical protein